MKLDPVRFTRDTVNHVRHLTRAALPEPVDEVRLEADLAEASRALSRALDAAVGLTLGPTGVPAGMAAAVLAVRDQWGSEAFQEISEQRHRQLAYALEPPESRRTTRVREMGARVQGPAGCTFHVAGEAALRSEPAYTSPGGRVYVSDSFSDQASDDALAFALGHEMQHALSPGDAAGTVAGTALERILKAGLRAGCADPVHLQEQIDSIQGLYDEWQLAVEKRADRAGADTAARLGLDPWKAFEDVTAAVFLGEARVTALRDYLAALCPRREVGSARPGG